MGGGALFGGPFKGVLFYLGYEGGTPMDPGKYPCKDETI